MQPPAEPVRQRSHSAWYVWKINKYQLDHPLSRATKKKFIRSFRGARALQTRNPLVANCEPMLVLFFRTRSFSLCRFAHVNMLHAPRVNANPPPVKLLFAHFVLPRIVTLARRAQAYSSVFHLRLKGTLDVKDSLLSQSDVWTRAQRA